jgi:hypothetical protein
MKLDEFGRNMWEMNHLKSSSYLIDRGYHYKSDCYFTPAIHPVSFLWEKKEKITKKSHMIRHVISLVTI